MSEVLYCSKCRQSKHWTQFHGVRRLARHCASCDNAKSREYYRKQFTPSKKLRMAKYFSREWGEICIY